MVGVRFNEKNDEAVPLQHNGSSSRPYGGDHDTLIDGNTQSPDDNDNGEKHRNHLTSKSNNVATREMGFSKQESMKYHMKSLVRNVMESLPGPHRNRERNDAQQKRLNYILGTLLTVMVFLMIGGAGWTAYQRIYMPIHRHKVLEEAILQQTIAARERVAQCKGIDWKAACDAMGPAGARRRLDEGDDDGPLGLDIGDDDGPIGFDLEYEYLMSDNPTVTFDENCLRRYRLQLYGNITFPYHASQLLTLGGVSSRPSYKHMTLYLC